MNLWQRLRTHESSRQLNRRMAAHDREMAARACGVQCTCGEGVYATGGSCFSAVWGWWLEHQEACEQAAEMGAAGQGPNKFERRFGPFPKPTDLIPGRTPMSSDEPITNSNERP